MLVITQLHKSFLSEQKKIYEKIIQ